MTTKQPEAVDKTSPACAESPRVDTRADLRWYSDPSHGVDSYLIQWSGEVHVGDCSMSHMQLTIRSDGTATFFAFVSTDDDDDQWVFYGGISLIDQNGAVLWTSPKLIGPNMPETGATSWFQEFAYPAAWWEPTVTAQINQAHC